MNIICFGDSITAGGSIPEGRRWTVLLQQKLDAWRPGAFTVYNKGAGGNTSSEAHNRMETDVIPLLPGLLLVEFGINDSYVFTWTKVPRISLYEYSRNLREFHRIAHAHKGRCAFIVNHPAPSHNPPQGNGKSCLANLRGHNKAVRDLARPLKAPVIDLPALLKQRKVKLNEFLAADQCHVSLAGQSTYADMVFEGLKGILE